MVIQTTVWWIFMFESYFTIDLTTQGQPKGWMLPRGHTMSRSGPDTERFNFSPLKHNHVVQMELQSCNLPHYK